MASSPVKKYAQALLDSYQAPQFDQVSQALRDLADAWESHRELRSIIENPALPLNERASVISDVAAKLLPGEEKFARFCNLLLHNGRLKLLPEISRAFARLVEQVRKLLALEITSAFPSDAAELNDFTNKLRTEFGAMSSVNWKVDAALLGGLVIKNGDTVLDNSVRSALERARIQLAG